MIPERHRHLVVVDADGPAHFNAHEHIARLLVEELEAIAYDPSDKRSIAEGILFVAKRLKDDDGDVYADTLFRRYGIEGQCPPHVRDGLIEILPMWAAGVERPAPDPDDDPFAGLVA